MKQRSMPTATFREAFGPGLMWAAAAIGVSHLVQSTRAGAMAGFGLAGVILLALVIKYPFFEYGPRYATATGRSLIEGYRNIGMWALYVYLALSIFTAAVHEAALLLFASFLCQQVLGLALPLPVIGAGICIAAAALLRAGHFRGFDVAVKILVAVLAISTLAAAAIALPRADFSTFTLLPPLGVESAVPAAFFLALVGFMPSALETSPMSSLWTLAKDKVSGRRTSPRSARLDLAIGYAGTGVLAFCFLLLGSVVMHDTDAQFSEQGTAFSAQLIDLYAETLGEWARPIVSIAALATILSTMVVVIDGFPRVIERCFLILKQAPAEPGESAEPLPQEGRIYWIGLIALAVLSVTVMAAFTGTLTAMLDFATILSFSVTPVLGYLNLRAVTSADVPEHLRPGTLLRLYSWAGLLLLAAVTVAFWVSRLL